jgi:hypothetical protein
MLDKRLGNLEACQPQKQSREERVLARCTEPELRQLVDIFGKGEMSDEDIEIVGEIFERRGWNDEPD